ncbi:JM125 [macacine gammaherpesvirus 11]|uniref:JM125 n=2 Tax=macacine gammaherpesvirus 11 TaxID=2560570 RepID=G9JMV3_9GAMA|nr:JM125 [Macaca fuscata rhadinovirus]AAT00102.1 JM125 [Macaca fuscata rhadinovirus]AEW87650.1 JM125 [Macaca fuscata rhadinovirus]AEW87820.1 JM125 [Macaca fuscata rhadinovirus]
MESPTVNIEEIYRRPSRSPRRISHRRVRAYVGPLRRQTTLRRNPNIAEGWTACVSDPWMPTVLKEVAWLPVLFGIRGGRRRFALERELRVLCPRRRLPGLGSLSVVRRPVDRIAVPVWFWR